MAIVPLGINTMKNQDSRLYLSLKMTKGDIVLFFMNVKKENGARCQTRTGTTRGRQILSLLCLPIPPSGQPRIQPISTYGFNQYPLGHISYGFLRSDHITSFSLFLSLIHGLIGFFQKIFWGISMKRIQGNTNRYTEMGLSRSAHNLCPNSL
jgi:hypothetical protein